jgi:deoxycytidylate deaminase
VTNKDSLRFAYHLARRSPDPSNQNGAVLARDGQVLIGGYNRFPEKFCYDETHLTDRVKKYRYVEHAERYVRYAAAANGIWVGGATMYCPWSACMECARAIIFSEVAEVVVHTPRMETTPKRWKASVDEALQYLDDCGVRVRYFDGPVGGNKIIVNGEPWQP